MNEGTVGLDYSWQVVMDNFVSPGPRSVTFADSPRERPSTAAALAVRPGSVMGDRPGSAASSLISNVNYVPLTIEPELGAIPAGKESSFKVKFSPLDMQEYEGRLICRFVLNKFICMRN